MPSPVSTCIRLPAIHCTCPTTRVSCACRGEATTSSSQPSSAIPARRGEASGARLSGQRGGILDRRDEVVVVEGLAKEGCGAGPASAGRQGVVRVARDEDDLTAQTGIPESPMQV